MQGQPSGSTWQNNSHSRDPFFSALPFRSRVSRCWSDRPTPVDTQQGCKPHPAPAATSRLDVRPDVQTMLQDTHVLLRALARTDGSCTH
jgi:hypothetical protein